MAKNSLGPATPEPSLHFDFGKDKGKLPKGFEDLQMGQDVELTVRGKISGLNQDEWGRSLRVKQFTVIIEQKGKKRPA